MILLLFQLILYKNNEIFIKDKHKITKKVQFNHLYFDSRDTSVILLQAANEI